MIRLWGKIIKDNRIINHAETTFDEDTDYQHQLKECITRICYQLDIQKPYWLPKNLEEYNRYKKTEFKQDNFIEEIDFDKFEIVVLDER